MNNYLITIFKQDNSVDYHTLTSPNIHLASMDACSMLKMIADHDCKYKDAGISVSEIKSNDQ